MRNIIDNFEIHAKQWLVNSCIYDSSATKQEYTEKRLELLKHQKSHFLILSVIQQWIDIESFAHLTRSIKKNIRENKQTCTSAISTWIKIENENLYRIWIGWICIYTWVEGKIKEKKIKFCQSKALGVLI